MLTAHLAELFESLVIPLDLPEGKSLSGLPIPGFENHRLAKDSSGAPCLLLKQPKSVGTVAPVRLQNLSVTYSAPCVVAQPSGTRESGTFTIVRCSSADPSLFPHFLRILAPVVVTLGPAPSAASVRRAISGLVDLFQALSSPSTKSTQGLWAELLMIRSSSDPILAIRAWHGTPDERIDFVSGSERIEVKSSSTRMRVHHFSKRQLEPPGGTTLLVASMFVERVGGGLTLGELCNQIRSRIAGDTAAQIRFDSNVYATLGNGWAEALDECFDAELALESLSFYVASNVPRITDPLPSGVADVRFTSDLTAAPQVSSSELMNAGPLFAVFADCKVAN